MFVFKKARIQTKVTDYRYTELSEYRVPLAIIPMQQSVLFESQIGSFFYNAYCKVSSDFILGGLPKATRQSELYKGCDSGPQKTCRE